MPFLNKVMLIGNLTRSPELRTMPNGRPLVAFGMATNRKFKRADGTEGEDVLFVDVTFFGPVAEVIHKWVHKGDPLYVEGRLRLERWQNDKGEPRTKISVTGDQFQFIPRSNRGSNGGNGSPAAPEVTVPEEPQPGPEPEEPEPAIPERDIPF